MAHVLLSNKPTWPVLGRHCPGVNPPQEDICLVDHLLLLPPSPFGCCCCLQCLVVVVSRQMLTYGRRIPPAELDYRIQQVDAKVVREVCSRYIYDKCPAIVGLGKWRGVLLLCVLCPAILGEVSCCSGCRLVEGCPAIVCPAIMGGMACYSFLVSCYPGRGVLL